MRVSLLLLLDLFLFTNAPAQDSTEVKLIQVFGHSEVQAEFSYTELASIKEEKSKYFYTAYNYNGKNQLSSVDFYMDHAVTSADAKIAFAVKE